jgi:uncharacterized membrane protein YkvA (DUF1232 family)
MALRITLEFSDKDLGYFKKLAEQALKSTQGQSAEEIIKGAKTLLSNMSEAAGSQYIQSRISQLRLLIDMLEDKGWGMQAVGRGRVLAALSYFNNPEDIIPDEVPVLGYLDDAIMVELLTRELKPEIDAYQDFVVYRASEAKRRGLDPSQLDRTDFLEAREQALLARMRRRRRSGSLFR